VATAIIPVGPACVYLSRLTGIGKLIAESAVNERKQEEKGTDSTRVRTWDWLW